VTFGERNLLFTKGVHKYRATKAYTFVPNICDALAWLHVARLARRILRCPQVFLENSLLALLHLTRTWNNFTCTGRSRRLKTGTLCSYLLFQRL